MSWELGAGSWKLEAGSEWIGAFLLRFSWYGDDCGVQRNRDGVFTVIMRVTKRPGESVEWGSDGCYAVEKDRDDWKGRSMAHPGLYRYPFDKEGEPVLTFVEAITAARNLETQLNGLMKKWTFPELSLKIVEHRTGYVKYEVRRQGEFVGIATVMPFSMEADRREPVSAVEGERDEEKNGTE